MLLIPNALHIRGCGRDDAVSLVGTAAFDRVGIFLR